MRRLKKEAVEWLTQHPEVTASWDGTPEARTRIGNAMKDAGVLRRETALRFVRIDLYVECALASAKGEVGQ